MLLDFGNMEPMVRQAVMLVSVRKGGDNLHHGSQVVITVN